MNYLFYSFTLYIVFIAYLFYIVDKAPLVSDMITFLLVAPVAIVIFLIISLF
jgi:hypothetical protein